jgi:hypothetical protein
MAKQKRKLTARQKAGKARLRQEFEWIFINGKQKRVRRAPTIQRMDVDEFIRLNADPILLHQEGLWGYLMPEEDPPPSDDFSLFETGDWEVMDTQSVDDLVESSGLTWNQTAQPRCDYWASNPFSVAW